MGEGQLCTWCGLDVLNEKQLVTTGRKYVNIQIYFNIPNGTCPDGCTSADRSSSHDYLWHTVTPHQKAESQVFQCSCGPTLEPHPVSSNHNTSGSDAGRCPNPTHSVVVGAATAATLPLLGTCSELTSCRQVIPTCKHAECSGSGSSASCPRLPPFPVFTSESWVRETVSNGKAEAHPLTWGLADGTWG